MRWGGGEDEITKKTQTNFKQSCTPSQITQPQQIKKYAFAVNSIGMIADTGAAGNYISIDTPHINRQNNNTIVY